MSQTPFKEIKWIKIPNYIVQYLAHTIIQKFSSFYPKLTEAS